MQRTHVQQKHTTNTHSKCQTQSNGEHLQMYGLPTLKLTSRLQSGIECVISPRNWIVQIYGLPTVRRDIRAPKKQSIANDQNYGNEPNSRQLINPAACSERGVSQQQLQQQLSSEALRYSSELSHAADSRITSYKFKCLSAAAATAAAAFVIKNTLVH